MFPPELEQSAFRATNGEFGWTRDQIPEVVDLLRSDGIGILGGELWWVQEPGDAAGWAQGLSASEIGEVGYLCLRTEKGRPVGEITRAAISQQQGSLGFFSGPAGLVSQDRRVLGCQR